MKATTTDTSVTEILLSKIQEPGDNPRTSIKDPDLAELQKSITQHGVLQPILVRSHNGHYELIAGARRIAASKAAGLSSIPAKVIEVDDRTAAALRLVENLQRKDLNAIEEAEGFSRLIKNHGYSAEEVAESSAKSLVYVRQRMKLVALPKEAKDALRHGHISPAVALLIARIPDSKEQKRACKEVLRPDDWGNRDRGPMGFEEAKRFIDQEFLLDLSRAPFKTDDAELVPAAGSCLACPKRTGNQADLFADVAKDSCTDSSCFNAKKKAHFDRVLEESRQKGLKVVTGKEAERIDSYSSGYVDLSDRCYDDPKSQTWRKLLGDRTPERTVALHEARHQNDQDEVKEYVPKKEALEVLKAKGHKWANPTEARSRQNAADKAREKALRLKQKASQVAIGEMVELGQKISISIVIRTIVQACLDRFGSDVSKRICKRRNLEAPKHVGYGGFDYEKAIERFAEKASEDQLQALLVEIVAQYGYPQSYSATYGKHFKELARLYNVKLPAIEKQLAKEKPVKKAKKGAGAK